MPEIINWILVLLSGIVSGLFAGNVGGAAFITFPVMLFIGVPTKMAIATLHFAAIILNASSAVRFYKGNELDIKFGSIIGIITAIGGAIGATIMISLNEQLINAIITFVFISAFIFFIFEQKTGLQEHRGKIKHIVFVVISSLILGIYGGFFGAGFGTLSMLIFLFAGSSFLKSASASRIVGIFMSLSATIVYASNGLINWQYGIILGLGYAIGSWLGIGYALKKGNTFVKKLLMVTIVISIIKLIPDLLI